MKKLNSKAFVTIGMLSAFSYVLMLLNFPLPGFPSFLKVDFSDIPAIIAAMIMGPVAGILVELLKNILDLLTTGSETGVPVGHIANFVTGILFVLTVYFIYLKVKSKKGLAVALVTSTIVTAVVMSVLNYYVFLPMYYIFLGYSAEDLPLIFAVTAILPFNLVKGAVISIVFILLFAKMNKWIHKQQVAYK